MTDLLQVRDLAVSFQVFPTSSGNRMPCPSSGGSQLTMGLFAALTNATSRPFLL